MGENKCMMRLAYPWTSGNYVIRIEVQIKSVLIEDILEYLDDLKSEDILSHIVSDFEDACLPVHIRGRIGLLGLRVG